MNEMLFDEDWFANTRENDGGKVLPQARAERAWSEQQRTIFDWFKRGHGNLVVRARAGTGKTTTIIEALDHAPEKRILLTAFNKRIQLELESRLRNPHASAKTLHALGFAAIQRAWRGGFGADPKLERERARAALGKEMTYDRCQAVVALVSAAKNLYAFTQGALPLEALARPALTSQQLLALHPTLARLAQLATRKELLPDRDPNPEDVMRIVVKAAARVLEESKTPRADRRISFDDMVYVPLACDLVRPSYDMVVVDEAQDMNDCQLAIAQKACRPGGRIALVGDDRQAIYGFRGADSNALDRLKTELSASELGLNYTYRCGKKIVAAAQRIVSDIWAPETAHDGAVDYCMESQLSDLVQPGDFVLSRKNAPLMKTCLRLLRAGIPAKIEGTDLGRELATVVKNLSAATVNELCQKVVRWSEARVKKLEIQYKNEPQELLVLKGQVTDKRDTLLALTVGAASVGEIERRCTTLFDDAEGPTAKRTVAVCSSVHKAKGLEADRVFLLSWTFSDDEVEERNIRYVAITRARYNLTWVTGELS